MIFLDKNFLGSEIAKCNFPIGLDIDMAKKAMSINILEKRYEYFKEMGIRRIEKEGLIKNRKYMPSPYKFYLDKGKLTLLLESIRVPWNSNSCSLDVECEEIKNLEREFSFKNFLEYHYCNVNHDSQAYILVSLWLNWYDTLKVILNQDN